MSSVYPDLHVYVVSGQGAWRRSCGALNGWAAIVVSPFKGAYLGKDKFRLLCLGISQHLPFVYVLLEIAIQRSESPVSR